MSWQLVCCVTRQAVDYFLRLFFICLNDKGTYEEHSSIGGNADLDIKYPLFVFCCNFLSLSLSFLFFFFLLEAVNNSRYAHSPCNCQRNEAMLGISSGCSLTLLDALSGILKDSFEALKNSCRWSLMDS